jgi:hypothetical protein
VQLIISGEAKEKLKNGKDLIFEVLERSSRTNSSSRNRNHSIEPETMKMGILLGAHSDTAESRR